MSTINPRLPRLIAPHQVGQHEGSSRDFLRRFEQAVCQHSGDVRDFWPKLLDHISDERNLQIAWNHLLRHGGQAPGPNGHRYTDYASHEVWGLLRALRDAIRVGQYQVGPARRQRIPKSSGHGFRILFLQNIEDRVVARAVKQFIEPLFDPLFDPHSCGFRPRMGREYALKRANSLALNENRQVWVVDDIRDAFDQIPRGRLGDVLGRRLPAEVVELAIGVTASSNKRGVIQGNPLSPLLLNVYLDQFLDQPWKRRQPDVPLIRTADDLLLCCQTAEQAMRAHDCLCELLTPAGMPLKGNRDTAVFPLRNGCAVNWLGYEISLADEVLAVRIGEKAWKSLSNNLELAHDKSNSTLIANLAVRGWIQQAGPCYAHEDREGVIGRVQELANSQAFSEAVHRTQLLADWEAAHERYASGVRAVDGPSEAPQSPVEDEITADDPDDQIHPSSLITTRL